MRKYLPLFLGVPGCLAAGWFELTRALGGREVAWVYTFEWPFYAVAGSYMWWRIWHHKPLTTAASTDRVDGREEQPGVRAAPERREDDPGLRAWQHYLANLEALDPPGGPPPRG
ncbi:MAG: hypothetical protein QOE76_3589 [Frankiales bacterium]|jgi:hypothetical protein|nr:hypothetical protein [Frankiales bacterium]